MATDKSEPRVGIIGGIAVLSITTILVVHAFLVTYFDRMAREETLRKVGAAVPEALLNLRADEKGRLQGGAEPIDRAMHDLVSKGRMSASPDIMPSASRDVAPLQGSVLMPQVVPPAMLAPPPSEEPLVAVDGGAGRDGGAARDAGPMPRVQVLPVQIQPLQPKAPPPKKKP